MAASSGVLPRAGEIVSARDAITAPIPPDESGRHVDQERMFAYRPALDGLRAIAVIAVLLYHGALFTSDPVTLAPGGFLGVDLFFVLSGFLISTLLVTEWQRTGTIRFVPFWRRRTRRLLPALLLVVAVVAGAYLLIEFSGTQVTNARRDMLGTLLYGYNWVAGLSGQSYFEAFDGASPLRHMWSLAIEEQFYLVWPLALFAMVKVLRLSLRAAASLTLIVALGSAALMFLLYQPGTDPSRIYYGTDTRAQAMLLGAFLALVVRGWPSIKLDRPAMQAAGMAGLAGCLALFVLVTDDESQSGWIYRGGFLLMAALAGSAVLAASGPQTTPLAKCLSTRPLVWIGSISYGLYLWHWPVYVVLDSQRTGLGGVLLLSIRVTVTVTLATLSFAIVEAPIRFGALRHRERRSLYGALGATAVAVIVVGLVFVTPSQEQQSFLAVTSSDAQAPVPRAKPGDLKVLLVGDSTALTLGLNRPTTAMSNVVVMTDAHLGCSVSAGDAIISGRSAECGSQRQRWADDVARFDPDVVVMQFGPWEVYNREVDGVNLVVGTPGFNAAKDSALEKSLSVLGARGAEVVALTSPCFKVLRSGLLPPSQTQLIEDNSRIDNYNAILADFAANHREQFRIADLHNFLCPGSRYSGTVNGVSYTSDGVHVNAAGGALVWAWLDPQLLAARPTER